MRVIVVGGGIGGLAAALALARGGAQVTVLERAPAFAEVGAGLQLSPNATRMLFAWGLEAPLRRIAFAPLSADIRDRRGGALLLSTPLGAAAEARWGAPYLQAHRADLQALLLDAAVSHGVRLRPGCALDGFEVEPTSVRVHAGGDILTSDVLVGADGIHSRVRGQLVGETPGALHRTDRLARAGGGGAPAAGPDRARGDGVDEPAKPLRPLLRARRGAGELRGLHPGARAGPGVLDRTRTATGRSPAPSKAGRSPSVR